MTSAIAATEQISRGQMGHPAACMIENNPVLSSNERFFGRAIMAPPGCIGDGENPPVAIAATSATAQSTARVDNFVGNLPPRRGKPRKLWACNGLLKT
ncbi:hypothetical protein [Piscinibacter sp.]|uniref:hypothetical protein n=1 Tax=Piscinibacter sp. TaxID=1903157 RepID=UPI002CB0DCD5|nr:hypothetical protein [Albitalea sp.]HUG25154.1 hypothetical protein [Albitalea sp.]